jgi:starch synthase
MNMAETEPSIGAALHPQARRPLRVLFLSVEVAPFAKTGGLGDVAGALPKALHELGADVRVCMPAYQCVDRAQMGAHPVISCLPVPLGAGQVSVDIREGRLAVRTAEGERERSGGRRDVPVYFVDSDHYFGRDSIYGYHDDGERFLVYGRAALEMCRALDWAPDVVHCNDWHTGIVPNWLKTVYRDDPFFSATASVYTIHNLAYQGLFDYHFLEMAGIQDQGFLYPQISELAYTVDLMGRGILFADAVTTVSERYAREILTPEFGERLDPLLRDRKDRLFGILNGIDQDELDPRTDPHLAVNFGPDSLDRRKQGKLALQHEAGLPPDVDTPIVAMIGRLSWQKGLDIVLPILDGLLRQRLQFVLLGLGDEHYHQALRQVQQRHPDRAAVFLRFDTPLAQRIYGGSDIFLMPSRYEPCGLGQMIAMRYGSVPAVRSTGGLADTVHDWDPRTGEGTGFVFETYDPLDCFASVIRAMETYKHPDSWRALQQRGMTADFSWHRSAEKYLDVYRRAIGWQAGPGEK